MCEMKNVVESIVIRSPNVVGQAISQVEAVATQDDDRLFDASVLLKFHLQPAWNPLPLRILVVEQRYGFSFPRPSAPCFFQVLFGRVFKANPRTGGNSHESPPDRFEPRRRIDVRASLQRVEQRTHRRPERQRIRKVIRPLRVDGAVQSRQVERLHYRRQASKVPQKVSNLFDKTLLVYRIRRVLPAPFLPLRENAAGFAEQTRGQQLDVLRFPDKLVRQSSLLTVPCEPRRGIHVPSPPYPSTGIMHPSACAAMRRARSSVASGSPRRIASSRYVAS